MGEDGRAVRTELVGSVLVVRLDRPERRNALGHEAMWLVREAFERAADDDAVRAVLTTGTGAAFSVGADMGALAGRPGEQGGWQPPPGRYGMPALPDGVVDDLGPGRWAEALLRCEKPTVAALNGSAAGGGLGLALLHDFRVAASTAKFAAGFAPLGLSPELGMTKLLPDLVGPAQARRLLLRAVTVRADEALAIGLVDEVHDPAAVYDAALALAAELAALPPLATAATKRLLRASPDCPLGEVLRAEQAAQRPLFSTADHAEGVAAFRERRSGRFEGR